MTNKKLLSRYLTYAGALPFIACTGLKIFDIDYVPLFGSVEMIINSYGLLIASFVNGAHWGQHVIVSRQLGKYLAICSNANVIALWVLFLLIPRDLFYIPLIISFILTAMVEKELYAKKIINKDYLQLRTTVTSIVCVSLLIYGLIN